MLRFFNHKMNSKLIAMVVLTLLASTLVVNVFGAADLSSKVAVNGLTVSSSGGLDWAASAGGAVWEGTTSSSGGCTPTYTATNGTLKFTNNSGSTQVLSFSYTVSLNGGSFTIDGESKTSNGSFSKTLTNGASVTLATSSSSTEEKTTKVTLSSIKLEVQQVTVTFAAPTNGSYTLNGTAVTADTVKTAPSTTQYKLVATPAPNYHFDGWYLGETKISDNVSWSDASFATSGTVIARFVEDPLYSVVQPGEGLSGTVGDYITVNSVYYHNNNGSYHTTTGTDGLNNSYGPPAYFPDPAWSVNNSTIKSSASGTAGGDNQTEMGRSNAQAYIYSDIIRVQVHKNCVLSFDCAVEGGTTDNVDESTNGVYFYYWVTSGASATSSQIMANGETVINGVRQASASGSVTVTLNAGDYLYLYSRCQVLKSKNCIYPLPASVSHQYNYSATISNVTLSASAEEGILELGNYDNVGTLLNSGTVLVNGTPTSVSSGVLSVTAQKGTQYTLNPGTAPAGYTFIGWNINGTPNYTQEEYSFVLTEGTTTIKAIYVPAMVITTGGENGYGSATYTLGGNSYLSGSNPYYVARNIDRTAFYTDLKAAFAANDTVVLLAGHTISGDLVIPTGKTLVIPYGFADQGISEDAPTQTTTFANTVNYCVVRFNGNLTINGELLVNGIQTGYSVYAGRPSGGIGCFVLEDSSVVTLNGTLYAYGHVRGGQINAAASAVVHELAEFSDRRAILLMNEIIEKKTDYRLMPFSAFSVESIESSVTYTAGAQLIAHFSMLMEGNSSNSSDQCNAIHPESGLFILSEGTMTKYYDFTNNQTVWRVDEGATVQTGNMSCAMAYSYAGMSADVVLNSNEYVFPFNQGHCIEVAGNFTFTSSFKFLPGSRFIVTETGYCTIASGADVIMYRMNDYDYRASGDKNNYASFSGNGYPCWGMQYPLGGYTSYKALKDLGSAKLVVDGTIKVNGGLFVSDCLVSESDQGIADYIITNSDGTTTATNRLEYNQQKLTKYDNGYNLISGSGVIDMTNASSTTQSVYEVMVKSGTNVGHYISVNIVSIKGLPGGASVDTPEGYQSLTGGIFYGGVNTSGLNVWVTDICFFGHAWDNDCDTECNNGCGETREPQHSYTGEWVVTEEGHAKKCVNGCGQPGEVVAHTWDNACDTDCNDGCGYTRETRHSYTESVTKEPTCTEEGVKTFACDCGDSYTEAIEATGNHTPGEAVEENRVESSCTEAGSYDEVVYCSVCKTHEISRTKKDLPLADHTASEAVEENRVESSCTEAGSYDEVIYCSVCKTHEISRTKKDLPLADHTAGEAVEENRVESSCTEAGSYDEVVYCSVCKTHEISRTKKDLPLTDHNFGTEWKTDGTNHWLECACGEKSEANAHIDEATKDHVCDICQTAMGEHADGDDNDHLCDYGCGYVADDGHHGGNATCTEQAICEECGERYGDSQGHTPGEAAMENYVESTWSSVGGYDMVVRCVDCGSVLSSEHHDALLNPFNNSPIVLDNSLTIAFNIKYATLDKAKMLDNGYYAIIVRTEADGTQKVTRIDSKDWVEYTKERYRVMYNDLPAKNMGDHVAITLYDSTTGECISVAYETSMKELAMNEIETCMAALPGLSGANLTTYRKQITMFVDMLNYGAAAQSYFTYDTENLVNKDLTAEMLAFETQDVDYGVAIDNTGVKGYNNSNMILESNILMRLCFFADQFNGLAMEDVVARVTYTHHNAPETAKVKTIALQQWKASGGRARWAVIVDWLVLADGDQVVTIELCDKQGNVLATATETLNSILAGYAVNPVYQGVELWPAMNKFMASSYARLHS